LSKYWEVKMKVLVPSREEADAIIDALGDMDEEGLFPEGAEIFVPVERTVNVGQ
jgi:hypothetical protein